MRMLDYVSRADILWYNAEHLPGNDYCQGGHHFQTFQNLGPLSTSEQLGRSQKAYVEQLCPQKSGKDLVMFTYAFPRLTALKTIRIDGRLSHLKEAKNRHHRGISSNRIWKDNDHNANCGAHLMVMLKTSIGDSGAQNGKMKYAAQTTLLFH